MAAAGKEGKEGRNEMEGAKGNCLLYDYCLFVAETVTESVMWIKCASIIKFETLSARQGRAGLLSLVSFMQFSLQHAFKHTYIRTHINNEIQTEIHAEIHAEIHREIHREIHI